jgi:A/G-specific adenine glycosylase
LLDKDNPALYNQAIMDFGATICKPKNPLCTQCVQQEECEAFRKSFVHELPVKEKSLQKKNRWLYYFLIEINEKVLIRKRVKKDIWQNLHEFVLLENPGPIGSSFQSHPFLTDVFGDLPYHIYHISKLYKQQLTHQNIHSQFIVLKATKHVGILHSYELIGKDKLERYAFPKIINQFMQEYLRTEPFF